MISVGRSCVGVIASEGGRNIGRACCHKGYSASSVVNCGHIRVGRSPSDGGVRNVSSGSVVILGHRCGKRAGRGAGVNVGVEVLRHGDFGGGGD